MTFLGRVFAAALVSVLLASACSTDRRQADQADDPAVETSLSQDGSTAEPTPGTTVAQRQLSAAEQRELDAAVTTFIQSVNVTNARRVVELMDHSGDQRFGPWLVDLAQVGLSNLLNVEIVEVLSGLTGVEARNQAFFDLGRMGSVIDSQGIDPGPGYRAWKLALYRGLDPDFPRLLDSVTDADRFARIRYGGVGRGGIPELNDPGRISSTEALEWITDDEVVLGVDLDGETVAYPFRIVGHHELVNDVVAGMPVSVVYCTLCRTGLLFDRRVDDRVLDFQTSGMLINSNKIMVDRQTDTLWHHAAGLGIGGPLEGTSLDVLPMETTTWAEWYAEHPDTSVLDIPEPIFFDNPERPPIAYAYEADGPYSLYYESPDTWFPIRQVSDALETKAEVIGIQHGGGVLAVVVEEIVSGPNRYLQIGNSSVVVVPNSRGARVYAADEEVAATLAGLENGSEVVVAASDGQSVTLIDGTVLERLAVEQGFWFSWFDRHPATELWPQE